MLLTLLACSGVEPDPDDVLFNVNALAEGPPRMDVVIENRRPQPLTLRFDTGTGSVYRMRSPEGESFALDQRDNVQWPRHCDTPCSDPGWECEPPQDTPWPVLAGGSETFDWNGELRRYTDEGCFETFRPSGAGWTLELHPRPFEKAPPIATVAVDFPVERIVLPVLVDLGSAEDPEALLERVKEQVGEAPSSWADQVARKGEQGFPVLAPTKTAVAEIGTVRYRLARAEETWELTALRGEEALWSSALEDFGGAGPQALEVQIAGDLVLVWGASPSQLLVQGFDRDDGASAWAWLSEG